MYETNYSRVQLVAKTRKRARFYQNLHIFNKNNIQGVISFIVLIPFLVHVRVLF